MQSERSYLKKKKTQNIKSRIKVDLIYLCLWQVSFWHTVILQSQDNKEERWVTSAALTQRALAHSKAAEWRENNSSCTKTTRQVTARVWRRQWSNGESAPKWRQTHLLCRFNQLQTFYSQSRRIQAYFRLQQSALLQCGVPVIKDDSTAQPPHTHTQIHKGLCADSNNKHTQCGPVRVWHLKIKPEECFLWRLRAATFWG